MSSQPNPTNPSSESSSEFLPKRHRKTLWLFFTLFLVPLAAAAWLLYRLEPFDPAPMPTREFIYPQKLSVPARNPRMVEGAEKIGVGQLLAPEDIVYEPDSGVMYTGCADGWVKRVTVNGSVVENWVNTGARPLGLAIGRNHEVIIADAYKGLIRATKDGAVKLLTDEAEGVKFKLTDGVDVADDGMIYFTDASYKYDLDNFIWDILEGRPFGRLLSYDPSTKKTELLARDLYFPNGVAVSPDQDFVIFCETSMRRCMKYYLKGKRKGTVDKFIDNLPGMPDNIRYDGEGHYWIALATEPTFFWNLAQKYPFVRKGLAIMERYVGRPNMEKNGGVLVVNKKGKPTAHYYDVTLTMVSSGTKIGKYLYCGSVVLPYILRIDLTRYPATAGI